MSLRYYLPLRFIERGASFPPREVSRPLFFVRAINRDDSVARISGNREPRLLVLFLSFVSTVPDIEPGLSNDLHRSYLFARFPVESEITDDSTIHSRRCNYDDCRYIVVFLRSVIIKFNKKERKKNKYIYNQRLFDPKIQSFPRLWRDTRLMKLDFQIAQRYCRSWPWNRSYNDRDR